MKIYKIQFKRMELKNKHRMILKILFRKSSHLYFNQISIKFQCAKGDGDDDNLDGACLNENIAKS